MLVQHLWKSVPSCYGDASRFFSPSNTNAYHVWLFTTHLRFFYFTFHSVTILLLCLSFDFFRLFFFCFFISRLIVRYFCYAKMNKTHRRSYNVIQWWWLCVGCGELATAFHCLLVRTSIFLDFMRTLCL